MPAVSCYVIRLVENEAIPGLGLLRSIFTPKTRLRGIKAFVFLFFFFWLRIRLLGSYYVEIHRDIVLLEVLAARSLAHPLRMVQVLS